MRNTAYKRHLRRIRGGCGLYTTLIERLDRLPKHGKIKMTRFPDVFMVICGSFRIRKPQAWDLLLLLHEFGIIELIPYQGIRVLRK